VLAGIALIVAVLFVIAAVLERTRALPLYGVALLLVSAILLNGIYPAIVQRFQVKPSEASLESPYIKRNIDATRDAYGLSNVEVAPYPGVTQATPAVLRDAAEAIPGIRLLDPTLVGPGQLVVDLVYQPPLTPWLEAARARGAAVANGVGMLVHQAALQLTLWTGLEAPVDAMWRAVSRHGALEGPG